MGVEIISFVAASVFDGELLLASMKNWPPKVWYIIGLNHKNIQRTIMS